MEDYSALYWTTTGKTGKVKIPVLADRTGLDGSPCRGPLVACQLRGMTCHRELKSCPMEEQVCWLAYRLLNDVISIA